MSSIPLDSIKLAEATITPKGAKQCNLCSGDLNLPVIIDSVGHLSTPFDPGNYDETKPSNRVNLEVRCNAELEAWAKKFDEWAVKYVTEHSERLFKKKSTEAQVRDTVRPLATKKTPEYPALMRMKLQTTGPSQVRYWDEKGVARDPPADWRNCEFRVRATIRSMYIMGKDMGFVVQADHLQIFERSVSCPFEACGDVCPM